MADEAEMGYFGGGSAHALAVPTTTAFDLAGSTVVTSLGTCFGLVVRSMGMAKGITAGFRSMVGGEVKQYTELLEDSRRHAMDRMVENAMLMGANAVIGVRFDSSEIGQTMTEIVAYGTAVVVKPNAS
jgi:uncharacterized protein YbjQ (UPF0145 family)